MVAIQPDEAAGFTQKDAASIGPETAVSAAPDSNTEANEPAHFPVMKDGRALRLASFDAGFSI
jgi:hypothetical protein